MISLPNFRSKAEMLSFMTDTGITFKYDSGVTLMEVVDNKTILCDRRLHGSMLTYMITIGMGMIVNQVKTEKRLYGDNVYRDFDEIALNALIWRDINRDDIFKFSNFTSFPIFKHLET